MTKEIKPGGESVWRRRRRRRRKSRRNSFKEEGP